MYRSSTLSMREAAERSRLWGQEYYGDILKKDPCLRGLSSAHVLISCLSTRLCDCFWAGAHPLCANRTDHEMFYRKVGWKGSLSGHAHLKDSEGRGPFSGCPLN